MFHLHNTVHAMYLPDKVFGKVQGASLSLALSLSHTHTHTHTHTYTCRWRAKVILLQIPVRDRPEVQLKAVAYGALNKKRPKWGHNRKWVGNYLSMQVCA